MQNIIFEGLAFALPLFIMAIGGIYSEKSGIINLALEGMQGVGAFCGAFASVVLVTFTKMNPLDIYLLSLLAAVIGGGLFALVHALLCIKFKANQVISGVVINILAMAITGFATKEVTMNIFGKSTNKMILNVSEKISIPLLADLPLVGFIFTNFYLAQLFIIILAAVFLYILRRTVFGLHLRAAGENPHALAAAGVAVSKIRCQAVIISGMLSGLAGISFAYSISANFSTSIYAGYGFLAIAAMIFGNWTITGTFFTCLVFGFARAGGYELIKALELPNTYGDLIMILPYVLTLLLLIFFSAQNRPPKALGEVYDQGKR